MRTQSQPALALSRSREITDALFQLVRPDSIYERPIAERHRIIFYLGHLEAFDWNLIGRYALDRRSFHPGFDRLFAFGIDPPAGQLPISGSITLSQGSTVTRESSGIKVTADGYDARFVYRQRVRVKDF